MDKIFHLKNILVYFVAMLSAFAFAATDSHKALLDTLLANGSINKQQYEQLVAEANKTPADDKQKQPNNTELTGKNDVDSEPGSLIAKYTDKGYQLATADGRFATNLLWRAQLRASHPLRADPTNLNAFSADDNLNFEARRLRITISGHAYQPWLGYLFNIDLQPTRDVDSDSADSKPRLLDMRVDLAKWDWGSVRIGQWLVDLSRERVDSSARQQFVERSIVSRVFGMDRQFGIQLAGRAFDGSLADINYWAGIFNGEGIGTNNQSSDQMVMARLQWNMTGRTIGFSQTDFERTDKPTASLALATMRTKGPCTRWSSDGCGNLDGFVAVDLALSDQYETDQLVQDFAFKYQGFSLQQELHVKKITDITTNFKSELTGGYIQMGYFFNEVLEVIPPELEFAARFAFIDEPNAQDQWVENKRKEYSVAANWFMAGHHNKLTMDLSRLTVTDRLLATEQDEHRIRLQWEISF
ncbi:MAG: porin [Kangiellaceae bacterium]|jgi:phosphate-selective porin|nr:porin [Kangiellaceae bacterium]